MPNGCRRFISRRSEGAFSDTHKLWDHLCSFAVYGGLMHYGIYMRLSNCLAQIIFRKDGYDTSDLYLVSGKYNDLALNSQKLLRDVGSIAD